MLSYCCLNVVLLLSYCCLNVVLMSHRCSFKWPTRPCLGRGHPGPLTGSLHNAFMPNLIQHFLIDVMIIMQKGQVFIRIRLAWP